MHHQPTQLALLISLIGLGVSPQAHALVGHGVPGADRLARLGCAESAEQSSSGCVASDHLLRRFSVQAEMTAALVDPLRVVSVTAALGPAAVEQIAMKATNRRAPKVRSEATPSTARLKRGRAVAERTIKSLVADGSRSRQTVKPRPEPLQPSPLIEGDARPSLLQGFDRFENAYVDLPRAAFSKSNDELRMLREAGAPALQANLPDANLAETPRQQNVRRILRDLRIVLNDDANSGISTSQQIAADATRPTLPDVSAAPAELLPPVSQVDVPLPLSASTKNERGLTSSAIPIEKSVTETASGVTEVDVALPIEVSAIAVRANAADVRVDDARELLIDERAEAASAVDVLLPMASVEAVDLLLPLEAPRRTTRAKFRSAKQAADGATPFGDRKTVVAEAALDGVRGGYATDGLNISFGISRAVYVNGELMTTTSLNVSDLGKITQGRTVTAGEAASLGMIQSGAGNVVSPTVISSTSAGAVVQNTLDGQRIQNLTVINASANSLGLLKGYNLESSLRGAVIDSLRR